MNFHVALWCLWCVFALLLGRYLRRQHDWRRLGAELRRERDALAAESQRIADAERSAWNDGALAAVGREEADWTRRCKDLRERTARHYANPPKFF